VKVHGAYVAQQPEEFRRWTESVRALKPQVYLEIGSLNGGTLLLIVSALDPGATIIVLDLAVRPKLAAVLTQLRARGFDVHLLLGDSTGPEVSGKLADILLGRWVDAAFIDGDHAFACVISDYRLCLKLIRTGGLMGFHDIATQGAQSTREAWEWIKRHESKKRITEHVVELPAKRPPGGSVGNGIGVVKV